VGQTVFVRRRGSGKKKDLIYARPEPGRSLKLDLYFPGEPAKKPRPAILCFYGA